MDRQDTASSQRHGSGRCDARGGKSNVQALSSAGDLVIPSRKANAPTNGMGALQVDKNGAHVLMRLTRSGRCKPMHAMGAPAIV